MTSESTLPTQDLIYTISVYEEDTILTDHRQNDTQFCVNGEELQKMFSSRITLVSEAGLRWIVQDGNIRTCLLEIPRQKAPRHLGYRGKGKKETMLEVSLPSMVFRFNIVTSRSGTTSVHNIKGWGFAGTSLKPTSCLYELPLPNFLGSAFCVGTADTQHRGLLRETIEQVIFNSFFNNHYDNCGKNKLKLPDFIAQCNGKVRLNQCNKLGKGADILSPKY